MKIDTDNLMVVKNYALSNGVSTSYIYRLIREGKMSSITIDGVRFIDVNKFPKIPGR